MSFRTSLMLPHALVLALGTLPTAAWAQSPSPEPPAPDPRAWRKVMVEVPGRGGAGEAMTRAEVRVLRADGTPVTVGAGLTEVGLENRLARRVAPPESPLTSLRENAGRLAALVAGGGMAVVGVVAGLSGVVLWGLALSRLVPDNPPGVHAVLAEGLFVALFGVVAVLAGAFTLAVAGIPWVWRVAQGPPHPDPVLLAAAGASLAWEDADATDAVARHNALLVRGAGPASSVPAAPAAVEAEAPRPTPPPPPPPLPKKKPVKKGKSSS